MGVERRRRGSLCPNWVVEKACPEEGMVPVTVTAAGAATRVAGGLAATRVASRAMVMREAAWTVVKTEAMLEDWTGLVVTVEAAGEVVETRVARAEEWVAAAAVAAVEAVVA